uniref:Formin homology 2 domain containing 3b n=1 Tax=Denticeps clupeoides TaxID=299321 RepID=A0AAY4CEV2_9TELE
SDTQFFYHISKLYTSSGRELRRALFSLKQIFQDDKDLVHDFVLAEGLSCLIRVGTEADQNYQNYILRALGQVMLFVDGMNGVIRHPETLQWLYSLVASKFRLVVKMALKLLLVFVEYAEANAALLVQAVSSYDASRGSSLLMIGRDCNCRWQDVTPLLNRWPLHVQTLAGLPDQDSYYDMVDCLEEQGFEDVAQRYLNRKGTDLDLLEQFNIYETTLRHEDGDDETEPAATGRKDRRRASVGGVPERRGLERRRSRRHSFQNGKGHASAPASPSNHGHVSNLRMEDMNKSPANQSSVLDTRNKVCENQVVRKEGRLEGLLWKKMVLQTNSESPLPGRTTPLPTLAPPTILKKESDQIWEQMMARPHQLHIRDMDFSDLVEEDDVDILEVVNEMGSPDLTPPPPPPPPPLSTSALPPPPPFLACPIPPPVPGTKLPHTPTPSNWAQSPHLQKKRKTIRLFWNEVRPGDWQLHGGRRCSESLWTKLEAVKVDTEKLENLFQTRSKDLNICKKTAVDGKRQEVIVLDSKRSNAINIGLTVLPPPRTIKTAILNFDEFTLNKEGIEKILSMIPTEEEKEKIQEAQLQNPDVPLGNAEQFLLTLSSISEISARLQLWAFRLDYDTMEKDIVEPLQDLKEGMEQLEKNVTLRYILSTLLAIGNFLNGSNAKGFELSYLEKVPEVKDTVHKQSLLHHACTIIVEKFPDGSDLYSEIGAITRSAKIDFDQLHENLCLMERRCKASWDHLKVISKHEMKIVMRQRMSDFLRDCTERIIILKTVHRRVINRFHAFLLFLGHPSYAVREVSIHRFCKMVSEFALEYRTARERVLQQKQKRANHRERNKTRGKMIIEVDVFNSSVVDLH